MSRNYRQDSFYANPYESPRSYRRNTPRRRRNSQFNIDYPYYYDGTATPATSAPIATTIAPDTGSNMTQVVSITVRDVTHDPSVRILHLQAGALYPFAKRVWRQLITEYPHATDRVLVDKAKPLVLTAIHNLDPEQVRIVNRVWEQLRTEYPDVSDRVLIDKASPLVLTALQNLDPKQIQDLLDNYLEKMGREPQGTRPTTTSTTSTPTPAPVSADGYRGYRRYYRDDDYRRNYNRSPNRYYY